MDLSWLFPRFVDPCEGPACVGAASPPAIDPTCIDENVEHDWREYRDHSHAERIWACNLCGREA